MYFSNALILNSGALTKIELQAPFNNDHSPKPLILVGANGSGKTGVLSIVADALIEIAAHHFNDITPSEPSGRSFFRIVGGRNQRTTATFELAALRFIDGSNEFFYCSKAGNLSPAIVAQDMARYAPVKDWPEKENHKAVHGPEQEIAAIYEKGAYIFFPSTRFEIPHWVNSSLLERDPDADFTPKFTQKLRKPIVVQSAMNTLKPWIVDVLLDQSVSLGDVLGAVLPSSDGTEALNKLKSKFINRLQFLNTYNDLNRIIAAIFRRTDARIVRRHRSFKDQRLSLQRTPTICLSDRFLRMPLTRVGGAALRTCYPNRYSSLVSFKRG